MTTTAAVMGHTVPRVFTPPLVTGPPGPCGCGCALTRATSYGFAVDDFARNVLDAPLDPWERWLVIHACELLPDGRPRFRKVLVIVARQNGKTHVLVVLSLYWLFVQRVALVLGTSTNLEYAQESWEKALEMAQEVEWLAAEIPKQGGVRRANGQQTLTIRPKRKTGPKRCRYKIAASTRRGGRSLTVHRLILDELREHQSWKAWNAAYNAMNAVPDAQAFAITNQGDDTAVVLDSLHRDAMRRIEKGVGDLRLGLFEWSAPKGSKANDVQGLAAANPNLGRRIILEDLLGDAERAMESGGEELAEFLTEIQCQKVPNLDPAINSDRWTQDAPDGCYDPGDLSKVRGRVACCADLSLDGLHATLHAAAVLPDGRVRLDPVKVWEGPTAAKDMGRDLPGLLARIKPQVFGWFPSGPAAAVAADLAAPKEGRKRAAAWPPPGVTVSEIVADAKAVCMGFAAMVDAAQVAHSDDPLTTAHVLGAEKLWQGDAWRFTRRGVGHVDGAYSAAGAVHLARTLPVSVGRQRLVGGKRTDKPVSA